MDGSIERLAVYASRLAVVLLVAGIIGGCAGVSRTEVPAQVEERSTGRDGTAPAAVRSPTEPVPRQSQQQSGATVAAYTPPRVPSVARPQPNRAVEVLMARAEDQRGAGDLDAAVASLERAVRIAPADAVLWHQLAGLRLAQGQYSMVAQLAAKSNALATPADRALRGDNWQLIAEARRGLGDESGARQAEASAARYR